MPTPPPPQTPLPDIESLLDAELEVILGEACRGDDDLVKRSLWGLALSGGGIRSATFALGVLQAMARHDLLRWFHFQSTVSGGGYIGGFVQSLLARHGLEKTLEVLKSSPARQILAAEHAHRAADGKSAAAFDGDSYRPIRHLREYSNYLSPKKSPLSGDTLGMIGSYVRNLLLIQIQLLSAMLLVSLLPLLIYAEVLRHLLHWPTATLLAAAVLGVTAIAGLFRLSARASRYDARPADSSEEPETSLLLASPLVITALALACFLGAIGLSGMAAPPPACLSPELTLPGLDCMQTQLGLLSGQLYFTAWLLWSLRARKPEPMRVHRVRFWLATFAASIIAAIAAAGLVKLIPSDMPHAWNVLMYGPTLVLVGVTATAIFHVGLAGPAQSDLQREIWARVGGKTAGLVVVGLALPLLLVVLGPWWLGQLLHSTGDYWQKIPGWTTVLAWLFTSGAGVLAGFSRRTNGGGRSRLLDLLVRIAPWIFVLGLCIGVALTAQWLLTSLGWTHVPALEPALEEASLSAYLKDLNDQVIQHRIPTLILAGIALVVWFVFGVAIDINEFSMNAFYRNRLVRCYLGAVNTARKAEPVTNFDPRDDLPMADLHRGPQGAPCPPACRPLYPLIGATLNLVAAKQLDWQDRKAASFCITPQYCGSLPPASRAGCDPIGDADIGSAHADAIARRLSLGTAIAISGAAVNPNMGYHSSPAVSFLLTLFDARLGWWLPNLCHRSRLRLRAERAAAKATDQAASPAGPWFPGAQLISEMLGLTHGGGKYVHLSDGGHFENLALYELVRRRCRFIFCVDAAADPKRRFSDLGNAIQKCRVDFGTEIEIDVAAMRSEGSDERPQARCAVGRIRYPDGSLGTLLYLKPTLLGDEPSDVMHYASSHPDFPQQPTGDQFFDEAQFESYRRLGMHSAHAALDGALERTFSGSRSNGGPTLDLGDSDAKERFLLELEHAWTRPSAQGGANFHRHSQAITRMFATLRQTPALSVLDTQMYPSWIHVAPRAPSPAGAEATPDHGQDPGDAHTRLPAPADFRACFYFCQELIRLMEGIYIDLDLEREWQHPDNRGWMNAFKQWSWIPAFRLAWAISLPDLGRRFATFSEMRLGLPRMDDAVRVDRIDLPAAGSPDDDRQFAARERINFAELGILRSASLNENGDIDAIYALRLVWRKVLARPPEGIPDLTLGIAAMSGTRLRMFRIQDHLRKLGLGAEFMRLLLARQKVDGVAIGPGHYGAIGVLTRHEARELEGRLEDMRRRALARRRSANEAVRRET